MLDVVYVALTLVVFVVLALLVGVLDRRVVGQAGQSGQSGPSPQETGPDLTASSRARSVER